MQSPPGATTVSLLHVHMCHRSLCASLRSDVILLFFFFFKKKKTEGNKSLLHIHGNFFRAFEILAAFFFESVVLLSSWAAPLFFSGSGRAIKKVSSCHWSIGADRHSAPIDRTGELKRSCTTGLDNGNTAPNSQLA